jgi:hypothetical protein
MGIWECTGRSEGNTRRTVGDEGRSEGVQRDPERYSTKKKYRLNFFYKSIFLFFP